ncbi:MAG: DUF3078 domain-containing protein [Chitinophagaceae bacterium]
MNITTAQVVNEMKRVGTKKRTSLDSNGWKRTGIFILNVNQSAQNEWGSGGENFMLGFNTILNKAIHHKKGKYTFDSYLDLELGLVFATSYKQFRKTTDRCDFTVELEHRIGKRNHFNYGILGNINTQLFSGHNYVSEFHQKISNFLSPGKALISMGIDYKNIKPKTYFSFFISPTTIRWVTKIDRDFYKKKAFGVDSLHKVYTEIGAYLSVHFNYMISKKTNLVSRLDLFSNYKRKPQNIDVLFNNVLSLNISKSFAATFILDLLYDHDIKSRTQVQQVSGIGLKLKL